MVAGVAALSFTPAADATSIGGFSGWPRLILYAAAGVLLGLTTTPARIAYAVRALCCLSSRVYALLAPGVVASLMVALLNARRLLIDSEDPLGPPLWILSMVLLLGYTVLPLV